MARPTKFNQKLANRILELYSSGKNLLKIEKLKGVPSRRTIIRWRKQFPAFGTDYDVALQAYSEAIVEQCLDIADNEYDPKRAKVMVDIRTWIASRYNRARFGDKLDVSHNIIVDIAPALLEANARMKAVSSGQKVLDVPCENVSESE